METKESKKLIIGCDIGGVVMKLGVEEAIDGALEGINQLIKYGHTVIFISKCGEKFKNITLGWLKQVSMDHIPIFFCRTYDGKIPIAKAQKLDVMIDDRIQVLQTFTPEIRCLWFSDEEKDILETEKSQPELFERLVIVKNWDHILDVLNL